MIDQYHVFPLDREQQDVCHSACTFNEVSHFTIGLAQEECALCQQGVCIQRYTLMSDDDGVLVVHGMLGAA